jgi:hypothetical protein
MTEDRRREKAGGEERRRTKGRLIQERDRLGLALVGMNRVVREKTLWAKLFPGRDGATFGNRVWELSRELKPVGAYWAVYRRTLDNGDQERYLGLTEVGYRQAEQLLHNGWFQRQPVGALKPSHVHHDLDLADFALALLPTRSEQYQPTVRGKPAGEAITVNVPSLPTRWRWRHVSVFTRLTVFRGTKDAEGRWVSKPSIALAYEPDAVLETDTFNCTRYFLEWDRGTEPIAGRETRTIDDKLRRIRSYFWDPTTTDRVGSDWSQRRSYYLQAFTGAKLRRPKVLIITGSAARARNIQRQAEAVLGDLVGGKLGSFLEILTVDAAREKLQVVLRHAELSAPPAEWPWLTELRRRDAAAARARAERECRLEHERRQDPLWAPYPVANDLYRPEAAFLLRVPDGRDILEWADAATAAGAPLQWTGHKHGAGSVLDRIRAAVSPSVGARISGALGLAAAARDLPVGGDETWCLLAGSEAALERLEALGRDVVPGAAFRVLALMLVHGRIAPRKVPRLFTAARAAWGDAPGSPWNDVSAAQLPRASTRCETESSNHACQLGDGGQHRPG